MKRSTKIIACAAGLALSLLILSVTYFFWFTPAGYRMSVSIHGFSEITENVYVEKGWSGDTEQLKAMIQEAGERVERFFEKVESSPILIICDNQKKINRLGGDHDTMTLSVSKIKSYISISSEYLNVDILAHEMTHGEIHKLVYEGRKTSPALIPIWFDEGLAIQNDTREPYSYETWLEITEDGTQIPPISEYNTGEKFYAGNSDDRRKRYCLAAHEVSEWIKRNGKDQLIQLLNDINQGEDFEQIYFEND